MDEAKPPTELPTDEDVKRAVGKLVDALRVDRIPTKVVGGLLNPSMLPRVRESDLMRWYAIETLRDTQMLSDAARLMLTGSEQGGPVKKDVKREEVSAAANAMRAVEVLRAKAVATIAEAKRKVDEEDGDANHAKRADIEDSEMTEQERRILARYIDVEPEPAPSAA